MEERQNSTGGGMSTAGIKKYTPWAVVVLLAILYWIICYPAFMSADSMVQYIQAVSGTYTDMHPPLMAIVLHYVLKTGGTIGAVTLIQSISGCIGVYLLSLAIFSLLCPTLKNTNYLSLLVLVILLSPLTPLAFYLITFWKDSWTAIGFIWICRFTLTLHFKQLKTKEYYLLYTLNFLCMLLVLLVRHNAIILTPVFCFILFLISRGAASRNRVSPGNIFPCLLLILLFFTGSYGIDSLFNVKKTSPANEVIALESVGALVNNIENKQYLPYIYSHLTPNYKGAWKPGRVNMWEGPIRALDSSFDKNSPELMEQYYSLLKKHPLIFLEVKWNSFTLMLLPWKSDYYFHSRLDANTFGLALNDRFKGIRDWLIRNTASIHDSFVSKYFFGGHLLWLIINLICIWVLLKTKQNFRSILICLFLIPLTYYLSYLIACTDNDYRFMYPSSLLIQLLSVVLLIVFIQNKKAARKNKDGVLPV
jgi:hypothetical protein